MRTSLKHIRIKRAVNILKSGGIIAYPTEAVFGFGCDPFNPAAVYKLLQLKQSPANKALILIASDWEYVKSLTEAIPAANLAMAMRSWPGPYTWIFPASQQVPPWIKGEYDTVALRITAHPLAHALCKAYEGPIVSTSANLSNQIPLRQVEDVREHFGDKLDFVLPGRVGDRLKPSEIKDILTGQVLRND
jgi:L-threonylcarbamoyladenylate synthase